MTSFAISVFQRVRVRFIRLVWDDRFIWLRAGGQGQISEGKAHLVSAGDNLEFLGF
jgi:hypothetical protein